MFALFDIFHYLTLFSSKRSFCQSRSAFVPNVANRRCSENLPHARMRGAKWGSPHHDEREKTMELLKRLNWSCVELAPRHPNVAERLGREYELKVFETLNL